MSRGVTFLAACAFATSALIHSAPAQVVPQGETAVAVKNLATTLGVKQSPNAPETLELGATITCMLSEPSKIAKFGVVGMHEGARVTITRIAPDRIRVEADEMEPLPVQGKVTLKIGTDGTLTPVPDRPPPKPPAE